MRYPLAPDPIFWTLQGEGHLRGFQMAFIRLGGCSVGCVQCDTYYKVDSRAIVVGFNNSDETGYPDCSLDFTLAFNRVLKQGGLDSFVSAPFTNMTKKQVVTRGRELGAPLDLTWSCYSPVDDKQCGRCDACVLREDALES